MTKNKFLKELDKSLYVLAEAERKDIINEYRDIIEEKVKHGKTEKEAVEEFGSVEKLTREILSAYKVNPDYSKNEDNFKESAKKMGNDFDKFIKEGAKKATNFTKEVAEELKENNHDFSIEFIFEILFKAIATLIIMFLASIPFNVVKLIGNHVLDLTIYPFNEVLKFTWGLFVSVLFIACCFAIFITMFKQYFKGEKGVEKEKSDSKKKESEIKATKESKKEEKLIVKNEGKNRKRKEDDHPILDIFIMIAKIVMILMMIPLFLFNVGVFISIFVFTYLMFKGLVIPGLLLLFIGLLFFFGHLQHCILNTILGKKKKFFFFPYVIGVICGIVGILLCFEQFINIDYYDEAPKGNFHKQAVEEKLNIDPNTAIINFGWGLYVDTQNIQVDSTLKNNEMKVVLTYDQDLVETSVNMSEPYHDEHNHTLQTVHIDSYHRDIFLTKTRKKMWNLFLENFKNHEIYSYDKLYDVDVSIYVNQWTKNKIDHERNHQS